MDVSRFEGLKISIASPEKIREAVSIKEKLDRYNKID